MLNFKKIALSVSLSVFFVSMVYMPTFASENTTIPKRIMKIAEEKVQADKKDIPITKAWEVDLNGNRKEVTPLNLSNKIDSEMSTLSVPVDEFTYVFEDYITNNPKTNWHYALAGVYRSHNEGPTPMQVSYIQQASTTKSWSVSVNISGTAEIGTTFLAKLKGTLGGELAKSESYYNGQTYGESYTVPGGETRYLANYTVGGYDNGTLVYKKYSPEGFLVGYYYESAGGTAINKAYVNLELLTSDPT